MNLTHHLNDRITLSHEGVELFDYIYRPTVKQVESPKPYFHPIRTLAGRVVTGNRPHDHRWHTGLAMTCAELSGQNFWGGPTFVRDKGYQWLENTGTQQHTNWQTISCTPDQATLEESLRWVTIDGRHWFNEARQIRIDDLSPEQGRYTLSFSMTLTNTSEQTLELGSPTTAGRENAGYGSLFWRGPRSFTGGDVLASDGRESQEMMGQRSPWLAFIGEFDGDDGHATLIFEDDPSNPRHPTQWFVRSRPFPVVSYAMMFDKVYPMQPGESLSLRYRMTVADGKWDRDHIEAFTGRAQPASV